MSPSIDGTQPNKVLITIIVMSAAIMQVLDTTIVNVAIPNMQGALNASPDEISWVLTSYLVASAICMPLTGYIADRIGRKTYLIGSIFGFTIASMLCGMSETLMQLVIFRILQGVFGASLVPLSQAIIADTYSPPERGSAMSIWGMGIMLGPILGPTLGGYFAEYFNWRWNFYVNVPVGIFATLGAWYFIDDTPKQSRTLDWYGFILIALGIGMLQFTLDRGNQVDWFNSNTICITASCAVISFLAFIIYSKFYTKNPIFSLQVITNQNFYASCIIMAFVALGFYGSVILQPIMMSNLFNYPEFTIGLVMGPRGIASMLAMLVVGRIIQKIHPKYILLLGLILIMLGNYACTLYTLDINVWWMIWPIVLQGIGIGLSFVPLSVMCLSTMPKQFMNEAAGLFSLMRIMGASTGVSIIITYFSRRTQICWNQFGGFVNPYNENLDLYLKDMQLSSTDPLTMQIIGHELSKYAQFQAIIDAFFVLSICFVFMLPLTLLFKKEKHLVDTVTIVNH